MNTQLPRLADEEKNNRLDECGICYARYLPIGDEHRPNSGNATDYTCENNSCSKAFHTMCLVDWLRSITTTRQSFNVLFRNCLYCSEAIAVKINATKN
ncbi:E3 ubiquitin-protein ligase FANCL-like [Hibiscus syriacus]|uniref:E3 ubiquitin-protein ligase FANCL-like n=1 Tax=Hibiscus syriacus TaxID=106335 RepID=UPI001924DD65|nr:E3 ubiquitin-protein ligase FANCL-like [Hibiscus syriacus]